MKNHTCLYLSDMPAVMKKANVKNLWISFIDDNGELYDDTVNQPDYYIRVLDYEIDGDTLYAYASGEDNDNDGNY